MGKPSGCVEFHRQSIGLVGPGGGIGKISFEINIVRRIGGTENTAGGLSILYSLVTL